MAGHFEILLRHVVTQPNAGLNALKEILAETDRQQQVTTRKEYKKANLQKLKTVKRKACEWIATRRKWQAMTGSQQEVIEGFRLSPQQKHLWLLQQEDPGRPYCTQCAVLIEGNLDPKILAAALRNVFARHEILRTTFVCLPGMSIPVQVISDGNLPSLDCYDLTGWGAAQQEARIEALFQEASRLPFDFEKGPLSRLSSVTLAPDKAMLLVTLSSLCADCGIPRDSGA